MQFNLILAGVGGQGILTIAQLITRAALSRGYDVKQSEVHGMSQRGGAVESHVRFADHPVHSELIPLGEADLILAVEPLEALRHLRYLRATNGAIVASSTPVKNIADYPDHADVLARIRRAAKRHVIVDSNKLAREAGSTRAENIVMLGAASPFMPFDDVEWTRAITETFAPKGPTVVQANLRAFQLGRETAPTTAPAPRTLIFEHEVYALLRDAGVAPPAHRFIPPSHPASAADLAPFQSSRVVVKLVCGDVTHKSDEGGVAIVDRTIDAVRAAIARMIEGRAGVEGVLLVEFIDHAAGKLGSELFVGFRHTRQFGPILAAGLGGVQTEYLAQRLERQRAIAMAPATDCSAADFLELFRSTAAYELISGQVRGHARTIEDEELIRCFDAFLQLARTPDLLELEVNPFAIVNGKLMPLDGRGRRGTVEPAALSRPLEHVARLLEPRSIAVLGVSAKRANFGRIILNNIQQCGFPAERLYVVKDGVDRIDGARCVESIAAVPEPLDLLVAATDAEQLSSVVRDAIPTCSCVILVAGAVGEKEGTEHVERELRQTIRAARRGPSMGPVFLGANCMGVVSRPGRYDTFFIPPHKRDPNRVAVPRRLAIISQSGAFIITHLSNLRFIDPAIAVSLGNQIDLTVADFTRVIGQRDDIDCIGVYVEGFNDLDGLEFTRAVRAATRAGKTIVFYKAGRTPAGRAAAQGHTASLAGDWDVCVNAAAQAGALVATSFTEFEQLLELAIALHDKDVCGTRLAAISNAGFETVGIADAIQGDNVKLAPLTDHTRDRLARVLDEHKLGQLVNVRNPLDLTPMADDDAYEQAMRALLDAPQVDALIVGCVPMTPQLLTMPDEIDRPGSIASRLATIFGESRKPLAVVVDSGAPYDALSAALRRSGVPVLRPCDVAAGTLGRYLGHRSRGAASDRA